MERYQPKHHVLSPGLPVQGICSVIAGHRVEVYAAVALEDLLQASSSDILA